MYLTNRSRPALTRSLLRTFFSREWDGLVTNPIHESEEGIRVSAALPVPPHIELPDYICQPGIPFGVYQGDSTVHESSTVELLRRSAGIVADTLTKVQNKEWKPGMTTEDIDQLVHQNILSHQAYPTPIGFMGFPKSVCTSVNEVLCHGIPNNRPLEEGDSINVDVTAYKDGVHGDSSVMVTVGQVDPRIQHLIQFTQQMLYNCIGIVKPGEKFQRIGQLCQQMAHQSGGYFVSELFTGHGIGQKLHMPPMVHHVNNHEQTKMEVGNVFTIEPIVVYRRPWEIKWWNDGFTVTATSLPSAQWEHTIAITESGVEVLTKREGEVIVSQPF